MEAINIKQSRRMIAEYVDEGALDGRVIDALRYKDVFLPKELARFAVPRCSGLARVKVDLICYQLDISKKEPPEISGGSCL